MIQINITVKPREGLDYVAHRIMRATQNSAWKAAPWSEHKVHEENMSDNNQAADSRKHNDFANNGNDRGQRWIKEDSMVKELKKLLQNIKNESMPKLNF